MDEKGTLVNETQQVPLISLVDSRNTNNTTLNISDGSTPSKLFQFVKRGYNWNQGSYGQLVDALKSADINMLEQIDDQGKTILHHAIKYPNRVMAIDMTTLILNHCETSENKAMTFVNKQIDSPNYGEDHHHHKSGHKQNESNDQHKQTALHLAAESASEAMVTLLENYGADMTICDAQGQTPLDLIYINLPRLTRNHFDSGVNYDESYEKIQVDFNKLVNISTNETDDFKRAAILLQETKRFEGLLKESPETVKEVLNHPLMQAFLYFKYQKAHPLILTSIFIHIFWHAIYAYFIFNVYYINCPWSTKRTVLNNSQDDPLGFDMQINCDAHNFQASELGLAITCWVLGIFFLAKEVFELCTVPKWPRYFLELENVGQLLIIFSVFWTSWPIYEYIWGSQVIDISPWQYKLACVTVFVVWALVLGQVCKVQPLRILIEIFVKVFRSFLLFICTFGSLLFAFAFSFCIIMPEGKAFKSPWLAVPKVLVMMTGELNYDDVFHTEDDSGVSPSHYLTTQLLFSLFTIVMSMILLNLLIGLAVTDTQELRANCHSAELSNMLEKIFLFEAFAARVFKVSRFRWLLDALSVRRKADEAHHPWYYKWTSMFREMTTILDDDGLKFSYSFARNEKCAFPRGLMNELRELADAKFATHNVDGEDKICQNCKMLINSVP